jgi:hypothetical protein
MREATLESIEGLRHELSALERALAKRGITPSQAPTGKRGDMPRRIVTILQVAGHPLVPKELREALNADGGRQMADSYVYSALARMLKRGWIVRDHTGGYRLPSQQTPAETPKLVEGYGRQSALTPVDGSV